LQQEITGARSNHKPANQGKKKEKQH